ncbi:MAG: hypothetical protein ABI114_00760, partial [Rhodanobacter sp.]
LQRKRGRHCCVARRSFGLTHRHQDRRDRCAGRFAGDSPLNIRAPQISELARDTCITLGTVRRTAFIEEAIVIICRLIRAVRTR